MILTNKEIIIIAIILLVIIIVSIFVLICLSNKAQTKILECNKCKQRQSDSKLLIKKIGQEVGGFCIHCNNDVTFTVTHNLKDQTNPKGWRFVGSIYGESFRLFNVDIFKQKWIVTGEVLEVYDPTYNEEHTLPIYKVIIKNKEHKFACGEFCPYLFAFYVFGLEEANGKKNKHKTFRN